MFYILPPENKGANWVDDVRDNLIKGMEELGVKTMVVSKLPSFLKESDWVFVLGHEEFEREDVVRTKAKVIGHAHGTSVNPYAYNVNRLREKFHFSKVLDLVTFSSELDEQIVKSKYGSLIKDTAVIGLPIDLEKFPDSSEKDKKIVVGGRISPDKQFYLASFLLQDLVHEYEIVFSILDKHSKWRDWYDIKRFEDMGFVIRENPTSERFYNELQNAEVYFTASLGDTIGLGALEAHMVGCRVIVPDIRDGFPTWRAYVSEGYEPFSKSSVESFIRSGKTPEVKTDLFDYRKVCQRLKEKCLL